MANTWIYASEDFVLKLPADLPEDGAPRPVHYESTIDVFNQALKIYGRYFFTIASIFLLPLFAGELLAQAAHIGKQFAVELAIRWITTVIAFAPLVHAVSDICIGNRPRLRRSYKRAGWRALLRVTAACALATLLITSPLFIGLLITSALAALLGKSLMFGAVLAGAAALIAAIFLSVRMFIWVLFVPVIIVVEPRVQLRRVIKRSRLLGSGFTDRTAVVIVIIALILVLASLLHQTLTLVGTEVLGIVFDRLLWPVPCIAITLIYYDLRARKEGYGIVERPEDLT